MTKEELEEIEKISDAELFDFDKDLDLTDNLILFGRRLLFKIVAIASSLVFMLFTYVECDGVFLSYIRTMGNEYVENYYLYDFGDDMLLEFDVPEIPTIKDSGKVSFITSKSKDSYNDNFSRYVSPAKVVYPPKVFEDFDKNIKVIRPNNNKLKVHYLGNKQIIVKIRENALNKGKGINGEYSTISEIYVGAEVKYKKHD